MAADRIEKSLSCIKFQPYLKADYQANFQQCGNYTAEDVCMHAKKLGDDWEILVTEKQDGVALLMSVAYEKIEETDYNNLLERKQAACFDKLNTTDKNNFEAFACVWSAPHKYPTLHHDTSSDTYFKLCVQLFAPKHKLKALMVPHLFRHQIDLRVLEIVKLHENLPVNKPYYLCFRCEFLAGNRGPSAANTVLNSWRGLSKEVRKILGNHSNRSKDYTVCREAHNFITKLADAQWENTSWLESRVSICILDMVLPSKIEETGLQRFSFGDSPNRTAEPGSMYGEDHSISYTKRLQKLNEAGLPEFSWEKYEVVALVPCNKELHTAILNNKVQDIEKLVKQRELHYDNEGFMVSFECVRGDYQNTVVVVKLKNFQFVTLSFLESKMNYDRGDDSRDSEHQNDTFQNMNVMFFTAGYHFVATKNFETSNDLTVADDDGVEEVNEIKKLVPNCFKLTRWGNFKDLNAIQNVDGVMKRFSTTPSWHQSQHCFLWSHYIKDARVRLNFTPQCMPLPQNGRLANHFRKHKPPELIKLIRIQQTSTLKDELIAEYDAQVLKDICMSTLLFNVVFFMSLQNNQLEEMWPSLGLIPRQMYKNQRLMDESDCFENGSFVVDFLEQCQNFESEYCRYACNGQIQNKESEWRDYVIENNKKMKKSDPQLTLVREWQKPGMIFDVKDFYMNARSSNDDEDYEEEDALRQYSLEDVQQPMPTMPTLAYLKSEYVQKTTSEAHPSDIKFFFRQALEKLHCTQHLHNMFYKRDSMPNSDRKDVYCKKRGRIPNYFDCRLTPLSLCFQQLFEYGSQKFEPTYDENAIALLKRTMSTLRIKESIAEKFTQHFSTIQSWWQTACERREDEQFDFKSFWNSFQQFVRDNVSEECEALLWNAELPESRDDDDSPNRFMQIDTPRYDDIFERNLQKTKKFYESLQNKDVLYSWSVGYNDAVKYFYDKHHSSLLKSFSNLIDEQGQNNMCFVESYDNEPLRKQKQEYITQLHIEFHQLLIQLQNIVRKQVKLEDSNDVDSDPDMYYWDYKSKVNVTEIAPSSEENNEESLKIWSNLFDHFKRTVLKMANQSPSLSSLHKHLGFTWILMTWIDLYDKLKEHISLVSHNELLTAINTPPQKLKVKQMRAAVKNHNHLQLNFGVRNVNYRKSDTEFKEDSIKMLDNLAFFAYYLDQTIESKVRSHALESAFENRWFDHAQNHGAKLGGIKNKVGTMFYKKRELQQLSEDQSQFRENVMAILLKVFDSPLTKQVEWTDFYLKVGADSPFETNQDKKGKIEFKFKDVNSNEVDFRLSVEEWKKFELEEKTSGARAQQKGRKAQKDKPQPEIRRQNSSGNNASSTVVQDLCVPVVNTVSLAVNNLGHWNTLWDILFDEQLESYAGAQKFAGNKVKTGDVPEFWELPSAGSAQDDLLINGNDEEEQPAPSSSRQVEMDRDIQEDLGENEPIDSYLIDPYLDDDANPANSDAVAPDAAAGKRWLKAWVENNQKRQHSVYDVVEYEVEGNANAAQKQKPSARAAKKGVKKTGRVVVLRPQPMPKMPKTNNSNEEPLDEEIFARELKKKEDSAMFDKLQQLVEGKQEHRDLKKESVKNLNNFLVQLYAHHSTTETNREKILNSVLTGKMQMLVNNYLNLELNL